MIAQDHLSNFFVRIVVKASNQVAAPVAEGQSRVLARSRNPILMGRGCQLSVEGFSLLHALDIGLQTSGQLLCQLVPWNVVTWIGSEQLRAIAVVLLWRVNVLQFKLMPNLLELSLIQFPERIVEDEVHIVWSVGLEEAPSSGGVLRWSRHVVAHLCHRQLRHEEFAIHMGLKHLLRQVHR